MSTSYYNLRSPWTSIRVTQDPGAPHARISLWEKGALAGELCVTAESVTAIVTGFRDKQVCNTFVAPGGPYLDLMRDPEVDCIVNEYGEVESWRSLRLRCTIVKWDYFISAYRYYDFDSGETGKQMPDNEELMEIHGPCTVEDMFKGDKA